MTEYATLGVTRAEGDVVKWEGKRSRTPVHVTIEYDDWTIDGVPLRQLVADVGNRPGDERSFMAYDDVPGARWAVESLRALLDEDLRGMDPWVRFGDGRVGLLFCPLCGDLNCGTLSAEVVIEADTVTWRAIAYQADYNPFSLAEQVPLSITFDRRQYDELIRGLMDQWTAFGAPPAPET